MKCPSCGSKHVGVFLDGSGNLCADCHTSFPPSRFWRALRRVLFGERYCRRHRCYEGGWRGAYPRHSTGSDDNG